MRIKKVYRNSAVVLIIAAGLSAFFEWKKLPAGIIIGGALGLANLKAMAWGVEGMIGTYKASGKLLFFSVIRLCILVAILAALLMLKLVSIVGVLIGFTVVFTIILKEGFTYAREEG